MRIKDNISANVQKLKKVCFSVIEIFVKSYDEALFLLIFSLKFASKSENY